MLANSFIATCCLVGVDRGCVPLMSATVAGTEGLWSPWCRCRMCCALPLALPCLWNSVWPHVPYVCVHHSTRRSPYVGYAVHCIPTASCVPLDQKGLSCLNCSSRELAGSWLWDFGLHSPKWKMVRRRCKKVVAWDRMLSLPVSEIKFKTLSSSHSVQGAGLSVCNQTPWAS